MRLRCAADKPIPSGGGYPVQQTCDNFSRFIKKRKICLVFIKFS